MWTVYHGEFCYATAGTIKYDGYAGHSATTNGICAGNNTIKIYFKRPNNTFWYRTLYHNQCDDWYHNEGHPVEVFTIWVWA